MPLLTTKSSLEKKMKNATSYEEWKTYALEHDKRSGMEGWKQKAKSKLYDFKEIQLRLDTLRKHRASKDDEALLFTLNEGIHGNMGGMGKIELYNKAKVGTKQLIVEYIDEISDSLLHLAKSKNKQITKTRKKDFFNRASICYGRSALMLSGGGQLGNFHFGVLKALADNHLLPKVISGASAGGIFAAYTNTKLDVAKIQDLFNLLIPNLTFQEAFEKTGRHINISISPSEKHQKSRLLNAISSPSVLIHSALLATSAIPGVYPPVVLKAKNKDGEVQDYLPSRKWVDGSMSSDLPAKKLARLYRINHFIVSLTNPLILPFVNSTINKIEFLEPLKRFNVALLKETAQFNYSMTKRFFKYMPSKVVWSANAVNSVIQQDYTGDINIVADFKALSPRKLLSALSTEELGELINQGEKKTWERLEAIRLTTKIGRVLDDILLKF